MKDPLPPVGNRAATPVTHSEVANKQEVNRTGRKFNRSVSAVKATPQKGLRSRVKNFLPRPLYKFLVKLTSSSNKAQYELGKAISLARNDSAKAWQKLGEYHALPKSEQEAKKNYELQLDCRKKDLKLDLLQGWGDSPVTVEKQEVIQRLEQCIEFPEDTTIVDAYEKACKKLKVVKGNEVALKLRQAKLKQEARALEAPVAEAKNINIRLSLEASGQLTPFALTATEQSREKNILKEGSEAFSRLKEIKAELPAIEADIKRYENSQVDDERAREALFHYENTEKARKKRDN